MEGKEARICSPLEQARGSCQYRLSIHTRFHSLQSCSIGARDYGPGHLGIQSLWRSWCHRQAIQISTTSVSPTKFWHRGWIPAAHLRTRERPKPSTVAAQARTRGILTRPECAPLADRNMVWWATLMQVGGPVRSDLHCRVDQSTSPLVDMLYTVQQSMPLFNRSFCRCFICPCRGCLFKHKALLPILAVWASFYSHSRVTRPSRRQWIRSLPSWML